MQHDPRKYLFDIQSACRLLRSFVQDKSFSDYESDAMLRSAVERQFEIIGEALSQFAKVAPDTVGGITDARRIIGFRNILIHGYAVVDNAIVWDIVQTKLPTLQQQTSRLLEQKNA